MLSSWGKYPFVRFLIFFVAGLYLTNLIDIRGKNLVAILVILTCAYLGFFFKKSNSIAFYKRTILGTTAILILVFLGVFHSKRYNTISSTNFSKADTIHFYRAEVTSDPLAKNNFLRFEANVTDVKSNGSWSPVEGKIRLFIKGSQDPHIEHGDQLLVKGNPSTAVRPLNPDEVDYNKILLKRRIYATHFISKDQYKIIRKSDFSIIGTAYKIRHWCDSILYKNITTPNNYQIASGLILGLAGNIDQEMQNAYSHTGVIHVLAVSGMHVVLIFSLLSLFFGGFNFINNGDK
ncbi:MAG TPA: ComEC family competence protein, partial [Cytophagaceae bacterium]